MCTVGNTTVGKSLEFADFLSASLRLFSPAVLSVCLSNDLIKQDFVSCPLCITASGVCLYFTQQLQAKFFCSGIG